MEKRLTFVLAASPYSGETAATVLKLATAAKIWVTMDKG